MYIQQIWRMEDRGSIHSNGLPLELGKLLSAFDGDFLVTQCYLPIVFCVISFLNAFVTIIYLKYVFFFWVCYNLRF